MKKLILFFLILFAINCSMAVAQEIDWQNTIGGSNTDLLYSIQQTTDGGYILGGRSNSDISGDKTENNIGSYDYWIVKTDSYGNIQWQNTIGGTNQDYLTSVLQTLDGGYLLGGNSISGISGDKTEINIGNWDYWIVKTDSFGNIQWQNTIGGAGEDELYSMDVTSDGGYILGGLSKSGISGDKIENSNGGFDYWIVKIDSLGVIQWQNGIGGSGSDYLNSVKQCVDGGFILGGSSDSNISGDKSENSKGSIDYWIIKTDDTGNPLFQHTFGGNDTDSNSSIQETLDGGFICAGGSISNISGDKTENCLGPGDFWILKLDSLGSIQWQNTIGGNDGEYPVSIFQTNDGEFMVGGYSSSDISADKTENKIGANDYWILKIDSNGIVKWQNTIGGINSDFLSTIQQTADGGCILGGYSYSNSSGDKTENSVGDSDFWIVKITDNYNLITGSVFADGNSNSVQDFGEPFIVNRKITEQSTGRFGFSSQNGGYIVAVLDSGNFNVAPATINNYNVVPVSHNAYFSGVQQNDSLNDFAFQPQGVLNDLCVFISPLGLFRNGFDASYMISYENAGTTTIAPTIIFFPDDNVSYTSSNVSPSNITLDSIMWSFGPINPFQIGSIVVTVHVNSGLAIGALINSTVRIDPVSGDANPACNYSSWEVFVTGSVDPNDILVNEDTLTTTQLSAEPFLDYIIRFQNTGNDTAFTVKILNLIDTTKLNLSSFEFLSSSHNVELKWLPWERNLEFLFNNILLPDSNVNEPLSHGNVRYRIKPKPNIASGDSIANRAAIYFDYNSPVLTNAAVTKIVLPTGLQSLETSYNYFIYPNPTTGQVLLELNSSHTTIAQLNLLTIEGKLISIENHNLKPGPNKLNLNTAELSSGIYLVRLVIDGNTVVKKLVKM